MKALSRHLCWSKLRLYQAMAYSRAGTHTERQVVAVRSVPGEQHMDLCFTFNQKQVKMHRPMDEPLGKTLRRMLISVSKPDKQAKKRQKQQWNSKQPAMEVGVYTDDEATDKLPEDTLNHEAWIEGRRLVLGEETYSILVNTPNVVSLNMPKFAVTGSAIIPEVEVEFTDITSCQWIWRLLPESSDTLPSPEDLLKLPIAGNSLVYWSSQEDAGRRLVLECLPCSLVGRAAPSQLALSPVITDMPRDTPITRRHVYTPTHLDSSAQFRVVTYNTLAEPFSSSEYAQNILYPYCDPSALHIHYRQSLIVHELLGYNADVICLQEVGTRTFQCYLYPALRDKGYDGCFTQKSGMIHEGEAIFFETSKFSLVDTDSTPLSSFLQNHTSCSELSAGLSAAPHFFAQVVKKHNIVMSALLESKDQPNHYLLVATTHLYYHPRGDHVRLVQVAIMMKFLEVKLQSYKQKFGQEATIATMICGDLNSCPCIAAYNFITSGKVLNTHPDWMVYKMAEIPKCECAVKLRMGTEEEHDSDNETERLTHMTTVGTGVSTASNLSQWSKLSLDLSTVDDFKGLDLEHSLHFLNVCGTEQVTNYTLGYHGILDYIFADLEHLSVERIIPFPSQQELCEFVALPSAYFPSDHISLVADLKWNV